MDGNFLAARTTFSGDFTGLFTYSPIGPVEPTGQHLEWEVIGIFRYDDEGRLAEEWVQTDYRSFLTKLGVTTTETAPTQALIDRPLAQGLRVPTRSLGKASAEMGSVRACVELSRVHPLLEDPPAGPARAARIQRVPARARSLCQLATTVDSCRLPQDGERNEGGSQLVHRALGPYRLGRVQELPSVFTTSPKAHRMQLRWPALTSHTLGRHRGSLANASLKSVNAGGYLRF